jgi:hypothetical protein
MLGRRIAMSDERFSDDERRQILAAITSMQAVIEGQQTILNELRRRKSPTCASS